MKREKELELLRSSLEITRGKKPFMSQEETLIPVANYLDQARFEEALTQWHQQLEARLGSSHTVAL